mgnify:CR=1 FL=1
MASRRTSLVVASSHTRISLPAVKDKAGAVLGPSEAPIPPHYEVTWFGDLPSVNVAFHVACSQANKYDGPGMVGVNLKCQTKMIYQILRSTSSRMKLRMYICPNRDVLRISPSLVRQTWARMCILVFF